MLFALDSRVGFHVDICTLQSSIPFERNIQILVRISQVDRHTFTTRERVYVVLQLHITASREREVRPLTRRKRDDAAGREASQARPARTFYISKMQNSELSEQEALESGSKITTDNADRFLEYHEAYGVLICVKHGYAVRNLADHLSRNHIGYKKERNDVCKRYKSLVLSNAKDVPLPPPLEDPIPALGEPQRAFVCREPECQYISISRKGIRLHCNRRHD